MEGEINIFKMKKIIKLKACNWNLLVFTVAILVSGIQLEVTGSEGLIPVWIHIALGLVFMGLVVYHIYLHFGASNWFKRFNLQKKPVTRILWWLAILTFVTGIIAALHWISSYTHSPLGGIHGKLGFVMIILSFAHIIKRFKFFTR